MGACKEECVYGFTYMERRGNCAEKDCFKILIVLQLVIFDCIGPFSCTFYHWTIKVTVMLSYLMIPMRRLKLVPKKVARGARGRKEGRHLQS